MCDTPVLSPHPTRFPEAEDTGQKFDKVFIPKGSLMLHEMPSPGSPDGKKKQMGVSESATHPSPPPCVYKMRKSSFHSVHFLFL